MKRIAAVAILCSAIVLLIDTASAQTIDTGGGTTGTSGGAGTSAGTGATGGTGTTSGGGGGFGSGGQFNPLDLTQNLANLQPDIPEFEDNRNQGFVGATTQALDERGFVGGLSQFVGGSSQEGSFGGGVNSSGGRGGARSGGGRGAGTSQNGFQVTRGKYIRARLRPTFEVPPQSAQRTVARFVNHLSNQPERPPLDGVTIRIENGTATLTGRLSNRWEAERIERQLRLEPGVYRIDNQLRIDRN